MDLEPSKQDLQELEDLISKSEELGRKASEKYGQIYYSGSYKSDWYDHRMHAVNFRHSNRSNWVESIANVTRILPMGGKMLDLCSGDAWFSYHFMRPILSKIVCIDGGDFVMNHAMKLHNDKKIEFRKANILTADIEQNYYDAVWMRSAIEHFSLDNQNKIAQMVHAALTPGGYYCGDTPRNINKKEVLDIHEFEWSTMEDARDQMKIFKNVELYEMTDKYANSRSRTTIFWRCQK